MELKYSLNEADYLVYQLYAASKSLRIKKQRQKNWIYVVILFFCLFFIFYLSDNNIMMYYFGFFTIISLIFYPLYQKKKYYNHFQKIITENNKAKFNSESIIQFNEQTIHCFDIGSETKINLSIVEEINEIEKYIYIKIGPGVSLIIPKLKLENIANIQEYLVALANRLNINYVNELDWKWK